MNPLDERAQFFHQLGLPRNESYDWAKRSFQNAAFDFKYFQNRRDNLRHLNINSHLLKEIGDAFKEHNFGSRVRNRSPSPVPPPPPHIGNLAQYFNESSNYNRARSRSPNRGNLQQQQSSYASFERNNSSHNSNQMGNTFQNQHWQMGSSNRSQNIPQNSFNNNTSLPNFDNFQRKTQLDNGINNRNEIPANQQNFNSQFQRRDPISTPFNRNIWQNNVQQSGQFNSHSGESWSGRNVSNFNNQFSSYQEPLEPALDASLNLLQGVALLQGLVQQAQQFPNNFPGNENSAEQSLQFQNRFPRRSNSNGKKQKTAVLNKARSHQAQPTTNQASSKLHGVKQNALKKNPKDTKQKNDLKTVTRNPNLIQVIKNETKLKISQNLITKTFPTKEIFMPSYKSWKIYFKSNGFVEKHLKVIDENDPEIKKACALTLDKNSNQPAIRLGECHQKLMDLLSKARQGGLYRDPYNFLLSIITLHELLFQNNGYRINQTDREACIKLLKQINIIDMINYYKTIVGVWRGWHGPDNSKEHQGKNPLSKSVNAKVFNWLTYLAFKELKRISSTVFNQRDKMTQLKELHEFTSQIDADKKALFLHSYKSKSNAKEFVRLNIDCINEYLKQAGPITRKQCIDFVASRVRLSEKDLDDELDADLKKEKDDLLAKLKTDPYAKKNYDFLIDDMLAMRAEYLSLQEADPRLILFSEKDKRTFLKKNLTRYDMKVSTNFLLDERLAENGTYLVEEIKLEETKSAENIKPISVPRTKEEQYKEFYDFCSTYRSENITNFFFDLTENATEALTQTMNLIKARLEEAPRITHKLGKSLATAKLRLEDKNIDNVISEDLKKEKYALLEKLKNDPYVQQNYEYVITGALVSRMRYLHLRSMDRTLLKPSERNEIGQYERFVKDDTVKYVCKHLLDERFAKTGTYLSESDLAEEKKAKQANQVQEETQEDDEIYIIDSDDEDNIKKEKEDNDEQFTEEM